VGSGVYQVLNHRRKQETLGNRLLPREQSMHGGRLSHDGSGGLVAQSAIRQICGSVIPPQVTELCVFANAALVASRGWLFQGPSLKGNPHEPRCTELLLWRRGRSLQFCRIGRLHPTGSREARAWQFALPFRNLGWRARHSRPTRSFGLTIRAKANAGFKFCSKVRALGIDGTGEPSLVPNNKSALITRNPLDAPPSISSFLCWFGWAMLRSPRTRVLHFRCARKSQLRLGGDSG